MQNIDWCWHCFADGMSIYYNKDWILRYPKVATASHDWLQYLRESGNELTDFSFYDTLWIIKKPFEIEWHDIMINGFKFLIEDFTDSKIEINDYKLENNKLAISFQKI